MKKDDAIIKILKLSDFWGTRVFQIAVKLNIFTLIDLKHNTVELLAKQTQTDPRALEMFLNALVGMRLLKNKKEIYTNSKLTKDFLVLGKKDYFGYGIKLEAQLFETFAHLEKSLKTGKPVRKTDMFQSNPEEHLNFIMAMHNFSSLSAPYLASKLSTKGAKSILDIGCGPGTYTAAFLKKNPKLKATLFDFPSTLQIAKGVIRKLDLEKRVTFAAGDYHTKSLPGKHDLVYVANVLHCEPAQINEKLCEKIYKALKKGGKVWIQERLLSKKKTQPSDAALFSLVMLLNTAGGQSYTYKEIETWLKKAGFSKIKERKIELPNGQTIIEATK